MAELFFLFPTNHDTIKAERTLVERGIECRVVPRPAGLAGDCGVALFVEEADESATRGALTDAGFSDYRVVTRED